MKRVWRMGAAACLAAVPAQAQEVTPAKPDTVLAAVQASGTEAKFPLPDFKTIIEARAAGYTYALLFQGCTRAGAECDEITLSFGIPSDAGLNDARIEQWIREHPGTEIERKRGGAALSRRIDFSARPLSAAEFEAELAQWHGLLGVFVQFAAKQ